MLRFLSLLLLVAASSSSSTPSPSSSSLSFTQKASGLFGIRGGGLFGGKDNNDDSSTAAASATGGKFPAMTIEEIEDWMEHVPVFAVTDSNGAGVVLKPDDETSVFYFFFNPLAANATLAQLKSVNSEMDLRVSAFSLGKIWFKLLNNDAAVELKSTTSNKTQTSNNVEYRLVPDTRDLLGARMLLTMSPEDSEKLKNGEEMTAELAQKAIERAMTESPKFKQTYNEIPVFTIAQMRMQREGDSSTTLLPMYFNLQNMVGTWQQFMAQASPDLQGVEPAINLMSLHDLVDMMQKESDIDFRNVVLVPPAPTGENDSPATSGTTTTAVDPMASMGGATLGDV